MTDRGDGATGGPLDHIRRVGIVPVLTVHDPGIAALLADALADGGLEVVEITMRTPSALDSIATVARDAPHVTVGAGTVTTADEAIAAIDAGAHFVVSPGLDDGVVAAARDRGIAVLPGVATPTEVMRARAMGIDAVKLFPAEPLGGPAMVRSLAAVWPSLRFVPTGGISASTAADYLASPAVLAVGGSWMVDEAAVSERRWDDLRRAAACAAGIAAARP